MMRGLLLFLCCYSNLLIATLPVHSEYLTLRQQALALTPEQLGITHPQQHPVLTLLMDVTYPEGTISLLIQADGQVSLLFSQGGGVLHLENNPIIAQKAQQLLQQAEGAIPHTLPTRFDQLPHQGEVQWVIHTKNDTQSFKTQQHNISQTPLKDLFDAGYSLFQDIMKDDS